MSAQQAAQQTVPAREASRGARIEALVVIALAAGVLIAAWLLRPDAAGFGTHEQLLVIPCAFRWITGLPCPMCGMTTSFTLMARCEPLAALGANVLGPPLYLATWLLLANGLAALARRRPPLPQWLRRAQGARWVLIVIGAGWATNVVVQFIAR